MENNFFEKLKTEFTAKKTTKATITDNGYVYICWTDDLDRVWRQRIDPDKGLTTGPKQVVALIEDGVVTEVPADRKERGEGMQKRQTLGVYVTPDEYKMIAHAAARSGISVSKFVKTAALQAAQKISKE